MFRRLCLITIVVLTGFVANAQNTTRLSPLLDALQLNAIFAVMQEEGVAYGNDLDREMLNNAGGKKWQKAVDAIYEPDRIWDTFLTRFSTELEHEEIDAMVAFFGSALGQRIVSLEISARREMLDKAVEEASLETLRNMRRGGHPRLAMLKAFIAANDLVEYNVMGAMNSNYAFYIGMIDGRAFDYELSESDVLEDIWSQEAEIRTDTEEWLYSYLALAYEPLSDEELQAYIDFSRTKAGRVLNVAIFAGFDDVFTNVSKALGLTTAQFLQGEEL